MAGSNKLVQTVLLLLLSLTVAQLVVAQDKRQCLDNQNGTLNFDVRGVPGPEGPRGERGPKGSTRGEGRRGFQGKTGEKGLKGDIGPVGIEGIVGQTGAKGQKGTGGNQGPLGPIGEPGPRGPQGVQGEPGDTVLSEEELGRVQERVSEGINASIVESIQSLRTELCEKIEALNKSTRTHCGIPSFEWKRVAYLDTTQGQACPPALRTFTNTTTNQKACGTLHTTGYWEAAPSAVSITFPTNRRYTHVCGRVRGYMFRETVAFWHHKQYGQDTIDSNYVDGVSITMGNPRQHLWTYAAGLSETDNSLQYSCPCARSNYDQSYIPTCVGQDYYCESGFVGRFEQRIVWEDALWDGKNCVTTGNTCCQRFGWFHREMPPTEDYIEVRWMKYWTSTHTEVLTDQLEIWVM